MRITLFLIIAFIVNAISLAAQNSALNFTEAKQNAVLIGLEPMDFDKDFSISFWVKLNPQLIDSASLKANILRVDSQEGKFPLRVSLSSTKALFITRSDGTLLPSLTTSSNLQQNEWYHVAVVKLKSMLFLYLNGELDAFVRDNTDFQNVKVAKITLGNSSNGQNYFRGALDELRVRYKALSDAEVLEDMKGVFDNPKDFWVYANFDSNDINNNSVVLYGFIMEETYTEGAPVVRTPLEEVGWFAELQNAIKNMRNGDPVNLQLSWFLKGLAGVCLFVFVVYLTINWEMNRRKRNSLEKEKRLNKELGKKKNELISQSLHLAKKNDFIKDINTELKQISKGVDTSNKKLNTILKTLRFEQNAEQDWEVFKTQFNEVHQDFDVKLKAISPDVTNTDIKLVAFLRMKMSNKEIAAILNVQPMSVKKSKSRLRKKLQMNPEEFQAFLDSL